jgi:hypothetical protein
MTTNTAAANWHKHVEGTWHGLPSLFDAAGNHVGFVQADRTIEIDPETKQPLIRVATRVDATGPLRARLEHPEHLLRTRNDGGARVYDGPDFYGAGLPFGSLVLGADYCVPWTSDNQVAVHVLPDGKTQAYSTLLYQGPTIHAVINGIYRLSPPPGTPGAPSPTELDEHRARERREGATPHTWPVRTRGRFRGELEAWSGDQTRAGTVAVAIDHAPQTPSRAEWTITLRGALERSLRVTRVRHGASHFYEGPDLFGNGIAYGRALFTTQHLAREPRRIRGREFLLDDKGTMSVVWEFLRDEKRELVLHGVLTFDPA